MNKKNSILKTIVVALVILFLSIVLNFLLNIASFESIYRDSLISKYQFMNKNLKNKIETDLNYGKPVYMLSSIGKYFAELIARDHNIANLFIAAESGKILYSYLDNYTGKHLIAELLPVTGKDREEAFTVAIINGSYFIASVITNETGQVQCSVFIEFSGQVINRRVAVLIKENLNILVICLLVSGIILVILLVLNQRLFRSRVKNIFLMTLVMVSTQVSYTFINTGHFENNYIAIMNEKVDYFSDSIEKEIQFFLNLDLSLDKLKDFDTFLAKELAVVPECEQIFVMKKNNVYYYADSGKAKKTIFNRAQDDTGEFTGTADKYHIIKTIIYNNQTVGKVITKINKGLVDAQIRDLFLDAATVLIISLILSYQLLLFPYLKVRRSGKSTGAAGCKQEEKTVDNDILVRLLSFLFYFAEILPLSFIPLLIASVFTVNSSRVLNLSENIVLGIPIACYLFGTAISVLVVGNFPPTVSQKKVFAVCSLLLISGAVGAALARSIWLLTFFRLISGIGYGGISIYSTALIISKYDKTRLATGFGFWASGYGAASICAIAIGGVVVFRFGFTAALFLSALFALLLMVFSLLYIKPEPQTTKPAPKKKVNLGEILNIFTDRNVAANFFLRLVPFHLMYVGIFQFTLPLLMHREEVSQADIGRILSLFGLLYIGMPFVSRLVDKLQNDKIFIFVGSLIIGCTLLLIKLGSNIFIFILLVTGISLGSLIADAAEESFITSTRKANQIGKTRLMTIYNSYERFLMVISPLICSILTGVFNDVNSIFIIGVFTLLCALLYFFIARRTRGSSRSAP